MEPLLKCILPRDPNMNILEKNLMVLASAGSGKTFCLSDRIIGLMAGGVEPERIVALTFTRKAAGEFADAILTKLAEAAADPEKAAELQAKFGVRGTDFTELLEKVVRRLPRLNLGTMDGFFSKILRGFQYELGVTGGKFDLLEGEVVESLRDELLEELLDGDLEGPLEEEFITIFRRATAGEEGARVVDELRKFINVWHQLFASPGKSEWGPHHLAGVEITDWEKSKAELLAQAQRDWPSVICSDKRQAKAFEAVLEAFSGHTIGSGKLEKGNSLLNSILEGCCSGDGALEVAFYKPFSIGGMCGQALRGLVTLAAKCELAAALSRTRGIYGVIGSYDRLVDRELRAKGRLGFDDVKRLMGSWMRDENARLRREAVDFRLDANYGHWLLDEFQDTSRDEWNALLPLVDEAITDDESTVFIVGDKKQAVYAWRGGEVALFDELQQTYGRGLVTETMAESWRSCPEVLDLVNRVCGDVGTMKNLFGAAAEKWEWQDHISAEPLTSAGKAGYARVEVVDKEEKTEKVIELLKHLEIGGKQVSCGLLVSTNKEVREWADELRSRGFEVVEEGAREPGRDHPVGVMIWHLLKWLANPADSFAHQTVMMSPLKAVLEERFGTAWQAVWEGLGRLISDHGFAEMLEEVIAPLRAQWSEFGKRRATDLLQALEDLDRQGTVTPREAADWIGRMKISQSPGVAAVQVMTVHKSKGLGFDVVVLPDVPTEKVPALTHYKTICGEGWITSAPTKWARAMIPLLCEAEEKWCQQQVYESFCKLYVAMTRAKRGLYIFLDPPAKSAKENKPSHSNWLLNSLQLCGEIGDVFETGNHDWASAVKFRELKPVALLPQLGEAVAKRARTTPSGEKASAKALTAGSAAGRRFGTAVHASFEKIGWLGETAAPAFPEDLRGTMEKVLAAPDVRKLLSRNGASIDLHREQRIEAVIGGKWLSGVIDRLHLHRDDAGEVRRVEIIDFKTDRVESAAELQKRYAGQMEAYQKALQQIYPTAEIVPILVSTALCRAVP